MRFDFTEDQHEIKRTAADLLAARSTLEKVREAAEAGAYDPGLWNELAELGWPGVAVDEQHGGGGLGYVELAGLLEEAGYALLNGPLLGTAACAAALSEAGTEAQRQEWLPRLSSGDATGAFGLEGQIVPEGATADLVVIAAPDGSAARLVEGPGAMPSVSTIDPTRRYGLSDGDLPEGEPLDGDVGSAIAVAAILTSAELVGVCRRALDMTVEYVKDRKQFGRPVGSFQAVQHRAAQMLLSTEAGRAATYFAAWAADADRERLAEGASLAKSAASRAGIEVTASAIQAHGGIGFTWEADVHWFYKRAQLDAAFLGSSSEHNQRLSGLILS